jgi:beta-glucosidase
MRSLTRLEDAARFQRDLQTKIMALSEHRIPAIFHMEGLCGAYLPGAVSFPSGICRGSSWRPEVEEKIGEIVGRQERTIGITHTFAPVLDISRDSRMGRQGESYGEDPTLAAAMGSKFVSGLQSHSNNGLKTHSVAKHFLGFHASYGGIHGTDCEVSDSLLREIYAKPFQAAISESNIQGVMPCYNSVNGEPIHGSQELLQGLLRDEMGFTGTLVSDYCAIMNMHSVQKTCNSFAKAGLKAMAAGMDYEVHLKNAITKNWRRCLGQDRQISVFLIESSRES